MSNKWRRFEVMLPLQFNDGSTIPDDWLTEAVLEITERFGASSFQRQAVEGRWLYSGTLYRDNLAKVVVDVPDLVKNRRWLRDFKKRWKERFQQLELWLVSFRIEIE
jgi:hypothetical protein